MLPPKSFIGKNFARVKSSMVLAARANGNGYCFRAMMGSAMIERGMGRL